MSYIRLVDPGFVYVVNDVDVHVAYSAIVEEVSVVPPSSLEALAEIPEAIIDAAIKTDLRAPISVIEHKSISAPSPICGSPEKPYFWSEDPSSRHPIIIVKVVAPAPVARGPNVTVSGTDGLLVNWKRWGSECDCDPYSSERGGRNAENDKRKQKSTNETNMHCSFPWLMIPRFPGATFRLRVT
jgi:hypothetical protein